MASSCWRNGEGVEQEEEQLIEIELRVYDCDNVNPLMFRTRLKRVSESGGIESLNSLVTAFEVYCWLHLNGLAGI